MTVPRTDDDWKGGDSADTPAGAAARGDGDADAAGKGAGPVAQRSRPLRKSLDKSATSKRADSPESRGAGEELKRGAEEEGRGRFASGGASAGGAERTDSRRWEGRGGGRGAASVAPCALSGIAEGGEEHAGVMSQRRHCGGEEATPH